MRLEPAILLACTMLGGCYGGVLVQSASPGAAPVGGLQLQSSFPADSVAGAVIIGVMLVDGIRYYVRYADGTRRPYDGVPKADPARRISIQDCTRPVDLTAGNLVCR